MRLSLEAVGLFGRFDAPCWCHSALHRTNMVDSALSYKVEPSTSCRKKSRVKFLVDALLLSLISTKDLDLNVVESQSGTLNILQ